MGELLYSDAFASRSNEVTYDERRFPETPFSVIIDELHFQPDADLANSRRTILETTYPNLSELEDAFECHFKQCDQFLLHLTEEPDNRKKWSQITQGYHLYIAESWRLSGHYRACVTSLEWLRDEITHLEPDEQKYSPYINAAIETITRRLVADNPTEAPADR